MSLFAGLDISVKTTAICVLDKNGKVLLETTVDSNPQAIAELLCGLDEPFERIGMEAGPLSQWIYAGLVAAELRVTSSKHAICTLFCRPASTRRTALMPAILRR